MYKINAYILNYNINIYINIYTCKNIPFNIFTMKVDH